MSLGAQREATKGKKLPLAVALVALYELAKVGFFAYIFLQCLQAQGSGIPPYGEVDAHNPLFEAPFSFLFAILAVYHLVLVPGLFAMKRWARAGSNLIVAGSILWWILKHVAGYQILTIPVELSTVLSALTLEAIAVGILYITPQAREGFAPTEQKAP